MAGRGRKARKRAAAKKPPARARKAAAAKPRLTKSSATKPRPRKANPPAAQSEIARLTHDLRAARERQAASAEILRAIASAPGDADRSLRQVCETTERLFGASAVTIRIAGEGDEWRHVFNVGGGADRIAQQVSPTLLKISGHNMPGTVYRENRQIHIPDLDNVPREIAGWPGLPPSRAAGTRTMVGTPLRREGKAIGALIVHRARLAPFGEEELALLQSFADQAVIAIENARLFNETREALEQQTATAEVLAVINSSAGDLAPVFDAILKKAHALCGVAFGSLQLYDGEYIRAVATHGLPDSFVGILRQGYRAVGSPSAGPLLEGQRYSHIDDAAKEEFPALRASAELAGIRTVLFVPLRKENRLLGTIAAGRREVRPFSEREISLLENFAAQAALAIENVRLFNQTNEALERQTATADVLQAISRSTFDLDAILNSLVNTAARLCNAGPAQIFRRDGEVYRYAVSRNVEPAYREREQKATIRPGRGTVIGRALLEKRPVQIVDALEDPEYDDKEAARIGNLHTMLAVPLLRDGEPVGAFALARNEVEPFTDSQIKLVSTFADQAVIAIENVRLFDETREALERQTATADILKVIASSPSDLQPVFEAIAERSNRLIGGHSTAVFRFVGDNVELAAFTSVSPEADKTLRAAFPQPFATYPMFQLARDREIVEIADTESENSEAAEVRDIAQARGFRSLLLTTLHGDRGPIGLISVTREQPGTFLPHHVQLLRTFADQAVIAIQNTRLFEEVQAKTRDLAESLQQQTATADVLKVISRSAFDLDSVMHALTQSAAELCKSEISALYLREGDSLVARGIVVTDAAQVDFLQRNPLPTDSTTYVGRSLLEGSVRNVADIESATRFGSLKRFGEALGFRAILFVPLMREGRGVGVFALGRKRTGEFSQREVDLVQTFADQAVIAIENVRLFDEVQARTRDLSESLAQQTATADVLKVISRSTFDLNAVLHTLVESAAKLADAEKATITRQRDGMFYRAESYGFSQEFMDYVRNVPIIPDRSSATSRALLEGAVVHIPDVKADPDYTFNEAQRLGDFRAVLAVPMLREDTPVGVIVLTRTEPQPFTDKQIELVTTFADQAAIAIENVRLFDSVEARTRELSKSLEDLRTAQDRLVQTEKLASLGQLTAGIAHEIKNPLNFVNNFSALSSELIDELLDVLKPAELGGNVRQEVNELTHMLKSNLDKVVQHGRRADSIVKNMLLHSRSGSGEHRPTEINAIVEESLNLAYHGARAEKTGFNITLQRDLDPDAGLVDVYPQEMARVLLNLISNGFYAATKRKAQVGDGFEPTLSASTRNLGDKVEIRVRDNGIGIPQDVKERMFNPFFTTKPAGEGTGLGLSMSHDIVVKQHQGRIDVETEPGAFTEFIITLPRAAAALAS
jgi:two-component system, NtrC family, sensor kinase